MSELVLCIGLLAQLCFSVRILVQWVLSEKEQKVVSPCGFWILSLLGSCLMFSYGWMRDDFSILIGQLIPFYIYVENLKLKQYWLLFPNMLRWILLLFPLVVVIGLFYNENSLSVKFFLNKEIPLQWIFLGTLGQILFTLRFIVQWVSSKRKGKSILPFSFWLISLVGSAIIIVYGLLRSDWILVIGHSVGIISYLRNLIIAKKTICHEM